ncbi:MAG: glutaredoxin family protein [Gammaproteobacteria bacterium]|nr:glutaredoxin family protein [Gammaproteobacteria bacterium]
MKKLFVILTVLFIIQKWDVISAYINPNPDYGEQQNEEVILYATSWCGYCAKTRAFMEDKGISYYEYNIEESTEGHRQFKSLGGNGVPLLLVNGNVIKGYNPKLILKYLD